jgi:hypothetical protein
MTIETYCDHCQATISTLLILAGPLHDDNIVQVELAYKNLTCDNCDSPDVSLRLIGGTAKFGSNGQEQEA